MGALAGEQGAPHSGRQQEEQSTPLPGISGKNKAVPPPERQREEQPAHPPPSWMSAGGSKQQRAESGPWATVWR